MGKTRLKRICKVIAFILILAFLVGALDRLVMPLTNDDYYITTRQFYEEPDNTIETLFFGSSVMYCGISPMELYEEYGICSYNLASNTQPLNVAYYWLREAYQSQSESLTTVVFEVSMLKKATKNDIDYIGGLWQMHFGLNKLSGARDKADYLQDFLTFFFPFITYHGRWKELKELNYTYQSLNEDTWSRGYVLKKGSLIESESYTEIGITSRLLDETADDAEFYDDSADYIEDIIAFCEEKGLNLLFIKTPTTDESWSDAQHNMVQELADENGIEFIDFNYSPYLEEIDFNAATDVIDWKHLNYGGMSALTSWVGEYLVEHYGASDVRDDEAYAFMDEELEEYHRRLLYVELCEATDLDEYLELVGQYDDYSVEIEETTDEDGNGSGTTVVVYDEKYQEETDTAAFDENGQRDTLDIAAGLEELLESGTDPDDLTGSYRELYLYNLRRADIYLTDDLYFETDEIDLLTYLETYTQDENHLILISSQGDTADYADVLADLAERYGLTELSAWQMSDDVAVLLDGSGSVISESCGTGDQAVVEVLRYISVSGGSVSSIVIEDEERSLQADGLNVVIYNTETELVVDAAAFGADGIMTASQYPEE